MTSDTNKSWDALYEAITDAIPDHPTRKKILQRLTDVRTAEMLDWSGQLMGLQARLDQMLKIVGDAKAKPMTPEEFVAIADDEETRG
jgi:hypothetical protein